MRTLIERDRRPQADNDIRVTTWTIRNFPRLNKLYYPTVAHSWVYGLARPSRRSLIKRREAASTWRVREGRIPPFSPCASFRDRVLWLCSIRDGVNRGNRRRHAAIAPPPPPPELVAGGIYATAGGHLGKTFPKAQFPRSASEPFTLTPSAAARIDRSLQLPTCILCTMRARCARTLRACTFAPLESDGKKRARVADSVAASYGDVRPMRRDESERSWESMLRGACWIACRRTRQKLEIRSLRLREIEILTALFTGVD